VKQEKNNTKRDTIIQAAISVLAERGFHNTKIRDVAQAAGVADGTIYLYFKNKDELLIQLFEEVMSQALEILNQAITGLETPEEKLRCLLKTQLRLVKEETDISKIISIVLRQSTVFLTEYENIPFSRYLRLIRSLIKEGVDEGVFREDLNVYVIERAIFGALDELALVWLLARGPSSRIPLDETANTICELILNGIKNQPEKNSISGGE